MRRVVLRCGSSNQVGKPLSLLVDESDRLIAGMSGQNESRSFAGRFTDRLSTEPYKSTFCLGVVGCNSCLEQTTHPCRGNLSLRYGMVEPPADVESESSHFEIIEYRPS